MFKRLREHPKLAPIFDDKLTRARVLSWATAAVDLAYGVAAFTFGYLGVAIAGIVRAKSDDPYLEQAVSLVSLAKAIVGMFFLTTALISEFGGESETFRFSMESGVGAVCLSSVVVIAIYMLVKARRERRRLMAA